MATTELFHGQPATAGERLQHLVAGAFARLAAVWRAARNRRSVGKLLEWDARMLGDIGLTPGDVRSVLAAPIGDDPSYRLGVLSVERRAAFRAQAEERLERIRTAQARGAIRTKSESVAAAYRMPRRVPPNRVLEI
jgi:uncharacterized protein YjiS (DUF1127 family)